ncbi:MAG: hypothetical protein Q7S40_20340 [Opitutaceae bacterium]|nr:hypothetical protein [Opitutaceae bacterium]
MINLRVISAVAMAAWFAATLPAAEEEAPRTSMKETVKARMLQEAKKKPPAPAPAPVKKETTTTAAASPAERTAKDSPAKETPPPASTAKTAKETPTVLPQVEVRNSRITEVDQQIAKQEHDIAREKQNTKSTETDKALNDPKISKVLSIFGGESSRHREGIAQERVSLMEAEKDILEAMKTARTKEEKAALQKQLDELRAFRRELEKSLR